SRPLASASSFSSRARQPAKRTTDYGPRTTDKTKEIPPMHPSDISPSTPPAGFHDDAWWKEVTGYQWFVFIVASLGWLFDTMDQQLFNLARVSAVRSLLHVQPGDPRVDEYAGYTTSIFMIGWALGGFFFGVLGDKLGRAKTMILTVLCY